MVQRQIEVLQKYINIPFKKKLFCVFWGYVISLQFGFTAVQFCCCLVLFGIFSFLCVCVYVCVSFFSSSKRKGRKISQLVKIIAWNEEHGIQPNFILTQRHQHLENNFSIRDISSQTFITLNGKGKILNCYKASVQLKWWEKDLFIVCFTKNRHQYLPLILGNTAVMSLKNYKPRGLKPCYILLLLIYTVYNKNKIRTPMKLQAFLLNTLLHNVGKKVHF